MLTETEITWASTPELLKPPVSEWKVAAFIIDEAVVEINIYTNEFCDILSSSVATENEQYENGDSLIDFTNKETSDVTQMRLSEKLSAIILTDHIFIVSPEPDWVVVGSKYINGEFVE
jgi:hypothetical protein